MSSRLEEQLRADIVEVGRIEASLKRFGDRFTARVLLEEEARYCASHTRPAAFVAARFAAKEAVSKAFGTGIGAELGWHDIEVCRRPSGQPYIVLHGKANALLAARGAGQIHLSLTHTEGHAAAVAVLESLAPSSHE